MAYQGFDTLPPVPADEQIQCTYTNRSAELQIVRIENIPGWYFERVIFPGQTMGFCATAQAIAQIYTCDHAGCLLDDHIRCCNLSIEQPIAC